VAEFAEARFMMRHSPVHRGEVARRVARIAATHPAVSIRLRSGDVEVSGASADSIARLAWRRGADLDVSCSGPGAEKTLLDIVSILDRPPLNDSADG